MSLTHHRLKDYYKILGVPASAGTAEIKRAYRAMAMRYHPDKNQGSALAEAQFREIHEAYATLADPAKRERYDDERQYNGYTSKTQYTEAVTPSWLAAISVQLNVSLAAMDTHRISHGALKAYILLILADAHLGILQQYGDKAANDIIISEILKATEMLEYEYLDEIMQRLQTIAGTDSARIQAIYASGQARRRKALQDRLFPYFILLITLALCAAMYFYGNLR